MRAAVVDLGIGRAEAEAYHQWLQVQELVAAIQALRKPTVDGIEVRMSFAIYESRRSGQPVSTHNGWITLPRQPGLALSLDPEAIVRYRLP